MESAPYQTLGFKTLFMFIARKCAPAVLLVIIAGVFYWGRPYIALPISLDALIPLVERVLLLGSIFFFLAGFLIGWITYLFYRYAIDEHALKIRRGIFNKREIAIPYLRIEDVDIEQDLISQLLGICRLVVLTAGHDDMEDNAQDATEGVFAVVDITIAKNIQAELLKRTGVFTMKTPQS